MVKLDSIKNFDQMFFFTPQNEENKFLINFIKNKMRNESNLLFEK